MTCILKVLVSFKPRPSFLEEGGFGFKTTPWFDKTGHPHKIIPSSSLPYCKEHENYFYLFFSLPVVARSGVGVEFTKTGNSFLQGSTVLWCTGFRGVYELSSPQTGVFSSKRETFSTLGFVTLEGSGLSERVDSEHSKVGHSEASSSSSPHASSTRAAQSTFWVFPQVFLVVSIASSQRARLAQAC